MPQGLPVARPAGFNVGFKENPVHRITFKFNDAPRGVAHMRWLRDIADHSDACLEDDGPTAESEILADRLGELKFEYLVDKDRLLLRHAVLLRCEAFLTVERRLPRNAAHVARELGIRILTPVMHREILKPWAALWR